MQTQREAALRRGDGAALWQDPYFRTHLPQAVLCLPLLRQGKTLGSLYLEHQHLQAAFPQDGREVVRVLAAQAAIAVESAVLYATLEQRVDNRTQELRLAQEKL